MFHAAFFQGAGDFFLWLWWLWFGYTYEIKLESNVPPGKSKNAISPGGSIKMIDKV
jgi:hypothetical protein